VGHLSKYKKYFDVEQFKNLARKVLLFGCSLYFAAVVALSHRLS